MDTVICKEVVIATIRRRGSGDNRYSPIRIITEVYEKDGTLIAEYDPSPESFAKMDLIHFAQWANRMKYDPDDIVPNMVEKWLDSIDS